MPAHPFADGRFWKCDECGGVYPSQEQASNPMRGKIAPGYRVGHKCNSRPSPMSYFLKQLGVGETGKEG